jgi:hypothetical protein
MLVGNGFYYTLRTPKGAKGKPPMQVLEMDCVVKGLFLSKRLCLEPAQGEFK